MPASTARTPAAFSPVTASPSPGRREALTIVAACWSILRSRSRLPVPALADRRRLTRERTGRDATGHIRPILHLPVRGLSAVLRTLDLRIPGLKRDPRQALPD